jgi:predicted alpha/beta-hydrolase family hydrolase
VETKIETSAGFARVAVRESPGAPQFLLVLTHGAGGTPDTADVLAVRDAGLALGAVAALVTQPYVVRGARAPGSAVKQDAAWAEIVADLRTRYPGLPLVQGGRSNGARVACRTAAALRARGVIALAFPLHPPGQPGKSRADELASAGTSVLVLNGDRDPFGMPEGGAGVRVVALPGETHALARDPAAIGVICGGWISELLAG